MGSGHGEGTRLGSHAPARHDVDVRAEFTDTYGVITFAPSGRCTLTAHAGTRMLRINATDEPRLRTIQDILTRDLNRMTWRDGLTLTWQPAGQPDNTIKETP
jgi:hypothetical protein